MQWSGSEWQCVDADALTAPSYVDYASASTDWITGSGSGGTSVWQHAYLPSFTTVTLHDGTTHSVADVKLSRGIPLAFAGPTFTVAATDSLLDTFMNNTVAVEVTDAVSTPEGFGPVQVVLTSRDDTATVLDWMSAYGTAGFPQQSIVVTIALRDGSQQQYAFDQCEPVGLVPSARFSTSIHGTTTDIFNRLTMECIPQLAGFIHPDMAFANRLTHVGQLFDFDLTYGENNDPSLPIATYRLETSSITRYSFPRLEEGASVAPTETVIVHSDAPMQN